MARLALFIGSTLRRQVCGVRVELYALLISLLDASAVLLSSRFTLVEGSPVYELGEQQSRSERDKYQSLMETVQVIRKKK
jgi:hypothetical protein